MSGIKLKFIETYFTNNEQSAEDLVNEVKQSMDYEVMSHSITKKVKKESEYYIIKITKEYNQEKNLI